MQYWAVQCNWTSLDFWDRQTSSCLVHLIPARKLAEKSFLPQRNPFFPPGPVPEQKLSQQHNGTTSWEWGDGQFILLVVVIMCFSLDSQAAAASQPWVCPKNMRGPVEAGMKMETRPKPTKQEILENPERRFLFPVLLQLRTSAAGSWALLSGHRFDHAHRK